MTACGVARHRFAAWARTWVRSLHPRLQQPEEAASGLFWLLAEGAGFTPPALRAVLAAPAALADECPLGPCRRTLGPFTAPPSITTKGTALGSFVVMAEGEQPGSNLLCRRLPPDATKSVPRFHRLWKNLDRSRCQDNQIHCSLKTNIIAFLGVI